MKQFLFYTFFVFGLAYSFAQISADNRLLARFSQTKLDQLELSQSAELQFWNYYLDNSYKVLEVGSKTQEFTSLYNIPATDPDTGLPFDVSNEDPIHSSFNPLKFDIPLDANNEKVYKLDSNRIIVFYSKKTFVSLFNQSL